MLRPYYPVLETELRHIPSLLRVWFGFSFCRCFSWAKYQAGAFFPAVSDIAMASKQKVSLFRARLIGCYCQKKDTITALVLSLLRKIRISLSVLWRCGVTFYQGYQGKELQDRSSISDPQNDQFLSRKPLNGQVPRVIGYRRQK